VLGYYTLAGGAIDVESLPEKLSKKLPQHPVPVVLLARLAVDQSVQGKGLGIFLLRDALHRSLDLSEKLRIYAVIVHSLDGAAQSFYERFGFLPLTNNQMHLFLPIPSIQAVFEPKPK
jgi:predicted N-acetyltransferase YhbS